MGNINGTTTALGIRDPRGCGVCIASGYRLSAGVRENGHIRDALSTSSVRER